MIKKSLTSLAIGAGCVAVTLAAGAGAASAAPNLDAAVNTTCTYPQLVAALNAQSPEAAAGFNQAKGLQAGLHQFLASGPNQRRVIATQIANAQWAQPYLPSIEAAFNTCQSF